ncbi:MAG: VOC family protein [Pseudomonadota bacterium]
MESIGIVRSNTILYCDDWMDTVNFYHDVLDLPVADEKGWFVEFKLSDNAFLSIADAGRASISSAHGKGLTLSFKVPDIDLAHRRLCESGVSVSRIKSVWGARVFHLHDPEGNRIELWT